MAVVIGGPEMGRAPDDLFGFMTRRSRTNRVLQWLLGWFQRKKERFTGFLILSLAIHILVFGLLAVSQFTSQRTQGSAAVQRNVEAVEQAVEGLRLDAKENAVLREALAGLRDEDELQDIMDRAPELDPRLGEREQMEVFRSLMKESLTRLGQKKGERSALDAPSWDLLPGFGERNSLRLAEGDILFRLEASADGRPKLYKLPAKAARKIESLRNEGDGEKGRREVRDGRVELRTERGFLVVPEEYYFRECPYEQMMALGGTLFYAVSGFPRLETPEAPKAAVDHGIPSFQGPADKDVSFIYFPSSPPEEGGSSGQAPAFFPPLSEGNIQDILDGLMESVDDDQMRAFKARYLDGHDAADPLLVRLTQGFLYGNLGGVFMLGDRLSTAFDFLEELYYNKLFQNSLVTYGLKNRRTPTGAEVLFCLAALYDFERRGLAHLADSIDPIESALADRPGRAEVFNKKAKAFVLRDVYRDFILELGIRGPEDIDSVLQEYTEEQARIYRLLVGMGGDVKNRALYALGVMQWDGGREGEAIKTWKQIDPAYTHPQLDGIRWVLSLSYGSDLIWTRIDKLFQEESRKNSSAALERLKKFHVWDKRSAKLRAAAVR